jgi:prepilin peptidase CpaA
LGITFPVSKRGRECNSKKDGKMIFNDTNIIILITILLTVAVINDIRSRRIPNMLTFPAVIAAIAYHSWLSGFDGFLFSIEGIGVGMAVFIVFYLAGGMGAGDVKLMGAVGGFLGPKGVFIAFLCTAVVGGVYALSMLMFHGYIKDTLKRYGSILKTFLMTKKIIYIQSSNEEKGLRLCYGVAIAIGTWISIFLNYGMFDILT